MEDNICGIYKIINSINEKIYIGQSININRRLKEHKSKLRYDKHINRYLQNSWNKYNEENFEFDIVEECTEDSLDNREKYWIQFYKSNNKKYGYNGDDGGNKNKHLSEETKEKISNSLIGREVSDETKLKISINHKGFEGKNHTDEVKEKISLVQKGREKSEETRKKLSESHKGKAMSNEHKKKLSESKKGKTKLDDKQIIEIREKYKSGNYTQKELADDYNCGHTTIGNIIYHTGAYTD